MIRNILLSILFTQTLFSCAGQAEKKKPDMPLSTPGVAVPSFNADSAFSYVARQLTFGNRIPNTREHKECAAWLVEQLKSRGANVIEQDMILTAYDGTPLEAKNIIAEFNPNAANRVLLFAHWDSRPFADHDPNPANHHKPVPGANDGASGVGVLLELARLMGEQLPKTGVDIIFFDAEDYGTPEFYKGQHKENTWALGTQYWARRPHRPGYTAKYGILLDMVGAYSPRFPKESFSNYFAPNVLDKVWNEASSLGYAEYFINEDGGAINDDHYYVNTMAGIPSIDIIHLEDNGFYPYWHTVDDTLDKIDPATLNMVGELVTNIIYKEK